jgi:membrane-associated phospholipid phosphatase
LNIERFLTDFADQAVILPLLLAVGIALWWGGWRRGALAWGFGVGAALALLGALKLLASVCHGLPGISDVLSPSGHTASAAAAFGAAAALLQPRPTTVFAVAAAAAAGVLIGWTRVALGSHVLNEVVVGLVVGVAGAALAVRMAGPPPAGARRRLAAVCLVAVLASAHGRHANAEEGIGRAGGWIAERVVALVPQGDRWLSDRAGCRLSDATARLL